MEFFEFDNSFIAGYGETNTSLNGGDAKARVVNKATGTTINTTCNQVGALKASSAGYVRSDGSSGSCVDDLPMQIASPSGLKNAGKLDKVKFDRAFK